MRRRRSGTARCHYTPFLRTLAIVRIVFHTEVVTHFVRNGCRHEAYNFGMVHGNPSGIFESTYRSFQCFTDDAPIELEFPGNENFYDRFLVSKHVLTLVIGRYRWDAL